MIDFGGNTPSDAQFIPGCALQVLLNMMQSIICVLEDGTQYIMCKASAETFILHICSVFYCNYVLSYIKTYQCTTEIQNICS